MISKVSTKDPDISEQERLESDAGDYHGSGRTERTDLKPGSWLEDRRLPWFTKKALLLLLCGKTGTLFLSKMKTEAKERKFCFKVSKLEQRG